MTGVHFAQQHVHILKQGNAKDVQYSNREEKIL